MLGKRTKREEQGLNLSFLDVVCCGFGAVILLLVITKIHEPVIIERSREELEGLILMLERELFEIRGESSVLKRDLEPLRAETSERVRRVDVTRREVEEAEDRHFAARETAAQGSDEAGNLLAARQSLTEEMERLLAEYRPAPNETTVGGIPVDSEYIIFVIDTSGSMVSWRLASGPAGGGRDPEGVPHGQGGADSQRRRSIPVFLVRGQVDSRFSRAPAIHHQGDCKLAGLFGFRPDRRDSRSHHHLL